MKKFQQIFLSVVYSATVNFNVISILKKLVKVAYNINLFIRVLIKIS